MSEVHLASLNVNGAKNFKKRVKIFEEIEQKSIDIAFLQETQSSSDNGVDWMKEFNGNICFKSQFYFKWWSCHFV